MKYSAVVIATVLVALACSCGSCGKKEEEIIPHSQQTAPPPGAPVYGFQIVKSFPHDPLAFTQGLLYDDGALYEGTGLNDSSHVRQVDLASGNVVRDHKVAAQYFGEGLALFDGRLYEITWQNNTCFVYSLMSFQPLDTFTYGGQGWGLTNDSTELIMSDGSNAIRFVDPANFHTKRTVLVFNGNEPVNNLNELEYVKGEIYANIWKTDSIVRIDPQDGKLLGWINLQGLLSSADRTGHEDVLNGIAYDAKGDHLYVTGKHWPKLFEIKLTGGPADSAKPKLR